MSDMVTLFYDNKLWRFIIDLEEGERAEPRLKWFTDNLRNWVVAGAISRASHLLLTKPIDISGSVGVHTLLWIGLIMRAVCAMQLYGLADVTVHYYLSQWRPQTLFSRTIWRLAFAIISVIVPIIMMLGLNSFVSQ